MALRTWAGVPRPTAVAMRSHDVTGRRPAPSTACLATLALVPWTNTVSRSVAEAVASFWRSSGWTWAAGTVVAVRVVALATAGTPVAAQARVSRTTMRRMG